MKTAGVRRQRGVSLVEVVVAISVLAVAVPLSLAAMTKAAGVSGKARVETRSPSIAEFVKLELEMARRDRSEIFGKLEEGQLLTEGTAPVLGFGRDGAFVAKLEAEEYRDGVERRSGRDEIFFVALATTREEERGTLVTVHVCHPAARKAEDREEVAFHTLLP